MNGYYVPGARRIKGQRITIADRIRRLFHRKKPAEFPWQVY